MDNLKATIQYYSKKRLFKYAVPFLILVVGGSFGLKQFAQLRYQYSKKTSIRPDELEKLGVEMKEPSEVTLEAVYETIKDLDIENWEPKRIPREWEEAMAAANKQ